MNSFFVDKNHIFSTISLYFITVTYQILRDQFSIVAILFVIIHFCVRKSQHISKDKQSGQSCFRHKEFAISPHEKENGFNTASLALHFSYWMNGTLQ